MVRDLSALFRAGVRTSVRRAAHPLVKERGGDMRRAIGGLLVAIVQLTAVTLAQAQAVAPADAERCVAVSPSRVTVELKDGATARGTLLCLGEAEAAIIANGTITRYPTPEVRRIVKPADPVYDGALKGAAFGAVILLFCGGDCEASYVLRSMAGYALIGTVIDSFDTHSDVLYQSRSKRTAIGWRVKF
jgi:hypothetical protein